MGHEKIQRLGAVHGKADSPYSEFRYSKSPILPTNLRQRTFTLRPIPSPFCPLTVTNPLLQHHPQCLILRSTHTHHEPPDPPRRHARAHIRQQRSRRPRRGPHCENEEVAQVGPSGARPEPAGRDDGEVGDGQGYVEVEQEEAEDDQPGVTEAVGGEIDVELDADYDVVFGAWLLLLVKAGGDICS